MRGVGKSHLPKNNCTVCGGPPGWRRQQASCPIEVRHRGERCRRRRFCKGRSVGGSLRRAPESEPAVAL
ncbi:MAG: DUF2256 domain-containing protein [Candidatus Competibacter sp.]|nr:DUF2256 domain-containing protein [Candidatus Competibacter sp.]MDG4585507.1 DUF2256 domain-containing protein [Candidatus Competibacter sp.]